LNKQTLTYEKWRLFFNKAINKNIAGMIFAAYFMKPFLYQAPSGGAMRGTCSVRQVILVGLAIAQL